METNFSKSTTNYKYECDFCSAKYIQKHAYIKHATLCELVNSSSSNISHMDNTPTTKQLLEVIQNMAKKINKLEENVEKLSKRISFKATKKSILDTLNSRTSNIVPSMTLETFTSFLSKMKYNIIGNGNGEDTMKGANIEQIMCDIFLKGYETLCERNTTSLILPIVCFKEQPNIIYVYKNDMQWSICLPEMFSNLVARLHSCVVIHANKWRDENVKKINGIINTSNDTNALEINNIKTTINTKNMEIYEKLSTRIYSVDIQSIGFVAKVKKQIISEVITLSYCSNLLPETN